MRIKSTASSWAYKLVWAVLAVTVVGYFTACCLFIWGNAGPNASSNDVAATAQIAPGIRGAAAMKLESPLDSALSDAEKHEEFKRVLGRGGWNILHRVAANYAKQPTEQDKADIQQFFHYWAKFYPCEECAIHFRAMLEQNPMDNTDNAALSLWLCKLHNLVNVRLNKPVFECTLENLGEAYGECGCFDTEEPAAKT